MVGSPRSEQERVWYWNTKVYDVLGPMVGPGSGHADERVRSRYALDVAQTNLYYIMFLPNEFDNPFA